MTALRWWKMFALEAALHEEAMGRFKDCSTGLIRIFPWSHTENWMADHRALLKNLKLRICNHLWWHQNFLKLLHQKTLSKSKALCDCSVKSAIYYWMRLNLHCHKLRGTYWNDVLGVCMFAPAKLLPRSSISFWIQCFYLTPFCESLFWQRNSFFPTRLVIPVSSHGITQIQHQ